MSLLVAFLTAVAGCLVAGVVAGLAVDWYRISSFEGKSGYYVVFIALVGFFAALVIGLIASRLVAGSAHPGFLRALGLSLLVVVCIGGAIAGVARLNADVPPRIGGEELLLAVEVRWPATQSESPAKDTTGRRLRLRAVSNRVARISRAGPLWMEDARLVDGRWVVPGAVEVYTSRGERLLEIDPAPTGALSWLVPLPAYPGKAQLAWSEWMPRARKGAPPLPDGFAMRFRVLPRDQPVRTQTFGPFEISTVAGGFSDFPLHDGRHVVAASATFTIRYRGAPVVIEGPAGEPGAPVQRFDRARSVALLPGAPDALLVRAANADADGPRFLVIGDGDHVRTVYLSPDRVQDGPLVTNDPVRFRGARAWEPVPGTVDERTYAEPGEYLFEGALLSTRPAAVRRFADSAQSRINPNTRPLGLSPDGRRIVRVGSTDDYKGYALFVTDVVTGESSLAPIDVARARVADVSELDPAWLAHYYAWAGGADGAQHLAPRENVVPLPWRGVYSTPQDDYREYNLQPVGAGMFTAMTDFLEHEMGATRTAEDVAASGYQARIGGTIVHVLDDTSHGKIGVFNERGGDSRIVTTIGEQFDAALATGKYDALFTPATDP